MRADAQRTSSYLNMRQHLPLDPLQVCERRHKDGEDDHNLDQAGDEEVHFSCVTVSTCTLPSCTTGFLCGSRYSVPGASMTELSILEKRPSVPEVNSVLRAERTSSGRDWKATSPLNGAVCAAPPVSITANGTS